MKYFIFHMERTGGTTFRHILFDHYGWHTGIVYPHYFEWDGNPGLNPFILNKETSKATFIIGHAVHYGIHELITEPSQYVVFLREPFQRMQSLWNHNRILNVKEGKPPTEFRPWFNRYKLLTQVWSLCRKHTPSLDLAKNILSKTSFIGLQETFQSDVDQTLHPYHYEIFRNTTKKTSEEVGISPVKFSEEESLEVRSVLDDDYRLYKFGLELRRNGHNKDFHFPV
jgi:hypothetical protein